MLRETLRRETPPGRPASADQGERYFRWRGNRVSRLEGLSDAIFALALTLLVVRLDVPRTFAEVRFAFLSAPVYLVCFALFLWVWYCHYQFHRRYGLEGPAVATLDGALLFCVLAVRAAAPLRRGVPVDEHAARGAVRARHERRDRPRARRRADVLADCGGQLDADAVLRGRLRVAVRDPRTADSVRIHTPGRARPG